MHVNWHAWWCFIVVAIVATVFTIRYPEGKYRVATEAIAWAALVIAILLPIIMILNS